MCKANRHTCALHRRQCDSGAWVLQPETWAEKEQQQHDRDHGGAETLFSVLFTPPSPFALGETQQLQHVKSSGP